MNTIEIDDSHPIMQEAIANVVPMRGVRWSRTQRRPGAMSNPKDFANRLVELIREGELRGAMIRRRDQLLAELAGLTAEIGGMPPGNRHDRRANATRLRRYLNKKGTTR